MCIAIAFGVMAELQGIQAVIARDRQAAVIQGHLNELPHTATFTTQQRRQDRLRRIHARHQIHHRNAKLQRWHMGIAIEGHQTSLGLDDQVVTGSARLRATGVITGHRAINQIRFDGLELLVTNAEFFCTARLEVVNHHIALRHQGLNDFQTFG